MSNFLEQYKELKEQADQLGISSRDVEETFIRSSGSGGQNVNKVATCVHLYYRSLKIKVKCQTERSQLLNRVKAWQLLLKKIKDHRRKLILERIHLMEKAKRQNRKRTRQQQEEILQHKKKMSEKKQKRHKIKLHTLGDYA